MEWSEFLTYMATTTGISVAVGVILSLVIEYLPKYELLTPKWKRVVFFGISFTIPLAVTALAIVTGVWGTWLDWETTWWPAVQAGFVVGSAGTMTHTFKM